MSSESSNEVRTRLTKHVDQLPILPQTLVRLLGIDASSDDYFDALVALIGAEPGFAARVLVLANSVESASRAPVTSIKAAVTRIGTRSTANLIVALSVAKVFIPHDAWEKSLWRHALQVAVASREFARVWALPELDPDEAYLCGLLHDVGRFVLFQEAPAALRRVDEGDWHSAAELVAQERAICGLTHPELGALACEHWKLPATIRDCVARHHERLPPGEATTRGDALLAVVRAADLVMFASTMPGTPAADEVDDQALQARLAEALPALVVLPIEAQRALIRGVREQAAASVDLLGLGPG